MATDSKFDYTVMKRAGFPPAMLPSSAFCPFHLRSHPGLEHPDANAIVANAGTGFALPMLCAQATFIPGGLVLGVYVHHSIIDGSGINRLLDEWSRGVNQRSQHAHQIDMSLGPHRNVVDSSNARVALDAMAYKFPAGPVPDCPEIASTLTKSKIKWLRPSRYSLKAKVFSIPAARILALQSQLQAHTSISISKFVTIATLFWTHVTRARGEALTAQGHSNTTLGIVVDTRKRIRNPIFKEAMGNMCLNATPSFSVPAILQATPDLVSIAASIASALQAVDEAWIAQRIAHIASIPNPRTFVHATTYANGPDLFITNWQYLYVNWVWNIPGTSADGKASAVRKPHYLSEGGVRILPRLNDGERDYEILVCLEEGEIERLTEGLGDMVARVVDG